MDSNETTNGFSAVPLDIPVMPVAWMHDQEGRYDVVHDEAKQLWLKAWVDDADSPTFRTRVLDQSRAVQFKDCSPPRHEGCPACGT